MLVCKHNMWLEHLQTLRAEYMRSRSMNIEIIWSREGRSGVRENGRQGKGKGTQRTTVRVGWGRDGGMERGEGGGSRGKGRGGGDRKKRRGRDGREKRKAGKGREEERAGEGSSARGG